MRPVGPSLAVAFAGGLMLLAVQCSGPAFTAASADGGQGSGPDAGTDVTTDTGTDAIVRDAVLESVPPTDGAFPEAGPAEGSAGDGGCGNLSTDPMNCGRCGHHCLGGMCVSGQCQPVQIASGTAGDIDIALDSTFVYWTNATTGTVNRMSKDGAGAMSNLATVGGNPVSVQVDATSAYGIAPGSQIIWRIPSGGGAPTFTLAHTLVGPFRLVLDATDAYWTDTSGYVERASLSVTGLGSLYIGALTLRGIAQNVTDLYVTTKGPSASDGTITKVDKMLLTHGVVVTEPQGSAPNGIAMDSAGTTLAWINEGMPATSVGEVRSYSLTSGTEIIVAIAQNATKGIAIDGSTVYWTNTVPNGTVVMSPISNAAAVKLASGQALPSSIAVDATAIYWANAGDGTIMKLAK